LWVGKGLFHHIFIEILTRLLFPSVEGRERVNCPPGGGAPPPPPRPGGPGGGGGGGGGMGGRGAG
jgi:hypothetical protein